MKTGRKVATAAEEVLVAKGENLVTINAADTVAMFSTAQGIYLNIVRPNILSAVIKFWLWQIIK